MSDLPIPLDLSAGGVNRDYTTIWADFQRIIPHLCPEWTYQGEDDPGTALGELVAYLGDHLHHRGDIVLRDLRAAKTIYRWMLVELAEWLGYFARRPTPAQTTVTITLDAVLAEALSVPDRSVFCADLADTIYFENLSAYVIPAGTLSLDVVVVEGRTITPTTLGAATGAPFERFNLSANNVLFNWQDDDLVVTVDGVEAQHVRWPRDAGPNDLVYWVRAKRDGTLQLRFGNGSYGRLLRRGAIVTCGFRQGGGVQGRVARNTINRLQGNLVLNGAFITVTVTNATRAIGGLAEEGIDEIRQAAPAFFRTQDRAVTIEDYEIYAKSVPGVFRVKAVQSGVAGVILYIVPDGAEDGDVLTPTLKSAIYRAFDRRKMATDSLAVIQADLIPIDIELNVFTYRTQRNAVVQQRVQAAFLDRDTGLLSFKMNELGKHLRISDMVNIVEDIQGVDYLDVIRFTRHPQLVWRSRLGTAVLSAAGISITKKCQEQVWTIYFITDMKFTVTGSVSGLQVRQGTLNVPYTDDNGELSFTIDEGMVEMGEGDRATISVSQLAFNVQLGAKEFPVAGSVVIRVNGGID